MKLPSLLSTGLAAIGRKGVAGVTGDAPVEGWLSSSLPSSGSGIQQRLVPGEVEGPEGAGGKMGVSDSVGVLPGAKPIGMLFTPAARYALMSGSP